MQIIVQNLNGTQDFASNFLEYLFVRFSDLNSIFLFCPKEGNIFDQPIIIFSEAILWKVFIIEGEGGFEIFKYKKAAPGSLQGRLRIQLVTEHLAQHASLCFARIHTVGRAAVEAREQLLFQLMPGSFLHSFPCLHAVIEERSPLEQDHHGGGVEVPVLQSWLHLRL